MSEGTEKDVDLAVEAAQKAFDTVWGLHTPGSKRGEILWKIADLVEANAKELAALESLDNGLFYQNTLRCVNANSVLGKLFMWSMAADLQGTIGILRYYAGWADKNHGKTMEVPIHTFENCWIAAHLNLLD